MFRVLCLVDERMFIFFDGIVQAIQYFGSDIQPAPYQTPEGIRQLLGSLGPYNLTKAEKLQIVNIAPQSMPVLWAVSFVRSYQATKLMFC